MIARALTIAGSDSGGGAGIQADLKTFTVFEVFGMSAVTALTAQNTTGVHAIHRVPAAFVRAQIDAVAADIGVDAAKTGMLCTADTVCAVAAAVRDHRLGPLVVDPVMAAESGAALLDEDGTEALLCELLPLAALVTPNIAEAERLTGTRIRTVDEMRRAADAVVKRGAAACLVTGGHVPGEMAVDVLSDGARIREFTAPRLAMRHTHGTGCQLSAAITANLARGRTLLDAIGVAKQFVTEAIRGGLAIGRGTGPANPLAWLAAPAAALNRQAR